MKKMQSVMTIRLREEDIKILKEISSKEKIDKSAAVRKLIGLGKVYFAISKYRDGKISIGKAVEIAGISMSEMIDILSKLGVKSKLEIIDYLEGAY